MSYVNDILQKDEHVEYQAELSWWSLWLWALLGGYFSFGAITTLIGGTSAGIGFGDVLRSSMMMLTLGAVFFGIGILRKNTTELVITNKRLIAKVGIVSKKTAEVQLANVEGVEVQQSIIGNLADYGTIYATGRGSSRVPVKGIKDPIYFRRQLSEIQEKQANKA